MHLQIAAKCRWLRKGRCQPRDFIFAFTMLIKISPRIFPGLCGGAIMEP